MPIEVAMPIVLVGVTAAMSFALGGLPERLGAIILVAWLGLERFYHLFVGPGFFAGDIEIYIALDLLVFLAFGGLALNANRIWPLITAALQSITLLGHLAVRLGIPGEARAYWAMTQMPLILMAIVVLGGTILHVRRARRIGKYRDWRRKVGP